MESVLWILKSGNVLLGILVKGPMAAKSQGMQAVLVALMEMLPLSS